MIFLGCEAVYSFTKLNGVTYQRAVTFITLFVFLHRPRCQMYRNFAFKNFSSWIRDYANLLGSRPVFCQVGCVPLYILADMTHREDL